MRAHIIGVIDDDDSMREAGEALIQSLGYEVLTFASARDFLQSDRINDVACLVVDLQMPEMSGIELRQRLVALENPIPTILITAHPDDRTRKQAIEAGILCYLTKPFSDDELTDCLKKALLP